MWMSFFFRFISSYLYSAGITLTVIVVAVISIILCCKRCKCCKSEDSLNNSPQQYVEERVLEIETPIQLVTTIETATVATTATTTVETATRRKNERACLPASNKIHPLDKEMWVRRNCDLRVLHWIEKNKLWCNDSPKEKNNLKLKKKKTKVYIAILDRLYWITQQRQENHPVWLRIN